MKKRLVGVTGGLILCLLLVSVVVAQDLWDIKKTRTSNMAIDDIFAVSGNVGWAITVDQIFKTTDGYVTLVEQTNPAIKDLNGLYFVNADTGFVFGDNALCLRTSDGGANWTEIVLPVPDSLNAYSCFFLNDTLGWLNLHLSSYHSCLIKTTDAGITWTYYGMIDTTKTGSRGEGYVGDGHAVFWDELNGAIGAGTGTSAIYGYYTTDGGVTWIQGTITAGTPEKYRPDVNGFGNAVARTGSNDARMFCLRGAMLKTTDRGVNWVSDETWWNPYATTVAIWDVCQIDDTYGFYSIKGTVGYGKNQIGRTTNSWNSYDSTQYVYTGTGANAEQITFADQNTGFALIQDNFILKTTDAGNTWTPVDPNAWPTWDFDRIIDYGLGHLMTISDFTSPSHSTDSGATWSLPAAQNPPVFVGDINGLDYRNGITLGVSGYSAALRSTDDGYTWEKITLPVSSTMFYGVGFADDLNVATGGSSGRMCHSTDAGLNWTQITTISNAGTIYKIRFKAADYGYLIGSKGTVFSSTDGGATWTQGSTITSNSYYDILLVNDTLGYATGYRGYLGKTVDGGTTWTLIDSLGYDYIGFSYGPTCYSIVFKSDSEGWIGADDGIAYHTVDGGLTWNAEPEVTTDVGDLPKFEGMDYTGGSLFGVGDYGFIAKYHPCGDANGDGSVSVSDVVYTINYLFKGGPAPQYCGDANGDGNLSVSDVVYMINYLFKGGPPPVC